MPRLSQASTSQASQRSSRGELSQRTTKALARPQNFDNMVKSAVKVILSASVGKLPFKRADIVKLSLNGEQKYFASVFEAATNVLVDVYNYEIHEVKKSEQSLFILTSALPALSAKQFNDEQKAQILLLYFVLTFIFMKGGAVLEEELWDFLKNLKIDLTDDSYFGDTKHLVEDTFIKQLYLVKQKQKILSTDEKVWVPFF